MDRSASRQYETLARSVPVTAPERERELSDIIKGDPGDDRDKAILELVSGNMRIVLDLTSKYRMMPDYTDTLFDGNLGLVKAAATFDHTKGKFSTWATPKIRTEIRDGMYARSSSMSSMRSASEVLARAKKAGNNSGAMLAKLAMMDFIPLYDEEGKPVEVCDHSHPEVSDQLHKSDLLELVMRASSELGLTEHDLFLISDVNDASSKGAAVAGMSKRMGITKSAVRMIRAKLVWMLRKKILGYVGTDEYLIISAAGKIPGRNWR